MRLSHKHLLHFGARIVVSRTGNLQINNLENVASKNKRRVSNIIEGFNINTNTNIQGFSVSGAGCVPLVNAVCCPNGYNACPAGTTCNLVNGCGA